MSSNVYTVIKCMYPLPFNTIVVRSGGGVIMKSASIAPVLEIFWKFRVESAKIDFDELVIDI